jgi:hypothetical protein
LAPAAGPGWEEPTSQLYPRLRTELDYVFTLQHLEGSACDDRSFYWRTRGYCRTASERGVSQSLARPGMPELALRAISLRHSARSVVTGSQRIGRTSTLISVASGMLATAKFFRSSMLVANAPRRFFVAEDDEDQTSERRCRLFDEEHGRRASSGLDR